MKPGTIYVAQGTLSRHGTRSVQCRECGHQYTAEFDETCRINQRVTARDAAEARYLVEHQHDVDIQSGVDTWLEPLTIEPLPVDQVLRELGAPELIPSPCVAPGFGAPHVPEWGHLQNQ